jgi:hypothetical protein
MLPQPVALQPYSLPNNLFALDEYARVSGVVQGRVQQGWVVPVAEGSSPFIHLLWWCIRVNHDHGSACGPEPLR